VHSLKLSKPPEVQFSTDEEIFARLTNGSIIFSKAPDFQGTDRKTPDSLKIAKFSLSTSPNTPTAGPLFVICYIPGKTNAYKPTTSGQPSFARMFRYPNFETVIASKSFFQADRVEFKWNKKGTAVLVITSTDIDKSGQSYYGKTMLHYMDTKGETAVIQTEADSAIVHAAEWSPTSTEFAIITGKMPQTRAVLMNTKCEVIIDMGVSARNAIYFNPQGNILLLGGFGNLGHGRIEMWEVKKHKKMIAMATASNTTQLEWLNDGVHFITAVTAPRMQVGNEFHVWNFKGVEIHKWAPEKHLFGIVPLRNEPPLPFPESLLDDFVKSQGNRPLAAKIEQQKKASVYVPPSKRGIVGGNAAGATKSLSGAKGSATAPGQSQLSENEKKIRTLKKKLEQIDKIKEMVKEGKPVEKNQEEKLKTEKEILEQIKALEI